ncbi:MAG: hypothetical protein WAK58_03390, partial [Trebonia sp.]
GQAAREVPGGRPSPAFARSTEPPPPRREAGNKLKPATARDLDRDCDHLAGITRPAMPNAVAEHLTSKTASSVLE